MNNQGTLLVVSGFSGAGKGTVIKELLKEHDNYSLSISATTRAERRRAGWQRIFLQDKRGV